MPATISATLWFTVVPLVGQPPSNRSEIATALARQEKYEQYALTHEGDAGRGRKLFFDERSSKCVTCHKVHEQGGEIGPDLSSIGGKFARPHLIESLLEPSRQIVEGYRSSVLLLADGKVVTGVIGKETAEHLSIGDQQGKRLRLRADQIEARSESDISLMPEGLANALTQQQFADLIAYLETLRPAGTPKHGAGIRGPIHVPAGFRVSLIASGLTGCTALETLPDGRVLISEQTGTLRMVKNGRLLRQPVLQLKVDDYWERGLLGVTIHPDFPQTPHLFLCYIADQPYPHHRISRFTLHGDVADPASEKILLRGDDQTKLGGKVPAGHQGGAVHFGPDGKLYVGIGEQTAKQPSQRLDSLLGKLLRLSPDGSIPRDNPFYGQTTGKYRAIWALGLRNPFTFAICPSTGQMCINDIGQNKFEEINLGVAGGNYGWPLAEGPSDHPGFRNPLHYYPNASACGADFAPPGTNWPSRFRGRYFFGEYIQGWIKTIQTDQPDKVQTFASGLRNPVDLRFAADGSLYVLLRNAWVRDDKFQPHTGSLLRIGYEAEASTEGQTALAPGSLRLTEDARDESAGGLPAFRIETAGATFYLEKSGAGLSSLIDRDGNDWLGFSAQSGSGAAGEYRGFPNAVHKQGGSYFHPRNRATDPSTTRVEYCGPERITIAAEAAGGAWACRYDFLPTHCTFTMTRMPQTKRYWVLYEGTPGGQYDDDDWWMTSAISQRQPLTVSHQGDIPAPEWIAFGDPPRRRSLLLLHHQDDLYPDHFYPMQQKMTVFGFGRQGRQKFLDSPGQRFSMGVVETVGPGELAEIAGQWLHAGRKDTKPKR